MNDASNFLVLPTTYWVALSLALALAGEAAMRFRERWTIPALMVYATVLAWYFAEPIYSPETMMFSLELLSQTYISVFIFLVGFRLTATLWSSALAPTEIRQINASDLPAERVFWSGLVLWLVLLAYGTTRMQGDIMGALFPVGARAGTSMWQRYAGADAGTFGFAVSAASYIYLLVLALFGMLLPLLKSRKLQALCIACVLISWPYAFLQGSRNVTLAVVVPAIFSFLFFSKARIRTKLITLGVVSVALEWALRQIITYRNVGFDYEGDIADSNHLGLNMASELAYSISFIQDGIMRPTLGGGFLAELGNVVPRFLWPDKPLIGIDFAIARGFATTNSDIGVSTTISTGMIGQGVLEFGPYIGPAVMSVIVALWSGWLARLLAQGTVPRVCLFLVGMGLTFNLGRNISFLVLWPMVFATVLIIVLERFGEKRKDTARKAALKAAAQG